MDLTFLSHAREQTEECNITAADRVRDTGWRGRSVSVRATMVAVLPDRALLIAPTRELPLLFWCDTLQGT